MIPWLTSGNLNAPTAAPRVKSYRGVLMRWAGFGTPSESSSGSCLDFTFFGRAALGRAVAAVQAALSGTGPNHSLQAVMLSTLFMITKPALVMFKERIIP